MNLAEPNATHEQKSPKVRIATSMLKLAGVWRGRHGTRDL